MHWDYGGGMGFAMGWFWIVLLVVIAFLAFNTMGNRGSGGGSGKSALDILKERYARGEIEKEEFEQKRRDLEES